MKFPAMFRRKPKPPLTNEQRRLRLYGNLFVALLVAPILIGRNPVSDAIAGAAIFAAGILIGMCLGHFQPWKKGVRHALVAAALSVVGIFFFTIVMSAVYVARNAVAVEAHSSYLNKGMGVALIVVAHVAALLISRKRWPDTPPTQTAMKA